MIAVGEGLVGIGARVGAWGDAPFVEDDHGTGNGHRRDGGDGARGNG